jgi:Zn-dependent protease with chaperone function
LSRLLQSFAATLLLAASFLLTPRAHASETPAEHAANVYAAQQLETHPAYSNLPDFSLPAAKLVEAQHLEQAAVRTRFVGIAWDLLQFVLILWLGIAAWIRDRALHAGASLRSRGARFRAFWLECLVFTVLLNALLLVLNAPLGIYRHWLVRSYGLSVQGWHGWLADQAKSAGLGLLGALFAFALIEFLLRSLRRTWWLALWGIVAPLFLVLVYIYPLVIDPMFNKFEPLARTQPELVARLEQVVQKGHMDIPPERMFLMKASAKVTTMNAYVTGFGGSKRVVVWDTSLKHGTPDEVLFIFGHESGHYVLGHVRQGMLESFAGMFFAFALAHLAACALLRRFGARWHIPSLQDWGALVVLLFVLAVFETISEPIVNAFSRAKEHAADVYGQEAIHGLVTNPQAVAQGSFDTMGENSLDVPNMPLYLEYWFGSHPQIGRRAAFAHAYDPWAPGMQPKYFPQQ